MRKHIGSSWNPDRVAGTLLNKVHKERAPKAASTLKIYKTSERFTELYGREAYEAWKAREAEIDRVMVERRYGRDVIVEMRENNYRQMKAAGEKLQCNKVAQVGNLKVAA